jgi:hypothetical protein
VQRCFDFHSRYAAFLAPAVANVLREYSDVFPSEIPAGLPPIRGIEHQIDLILGALLPKRALNRTNPEEMKEIQRQVQELLDKGYVSLCYFSYFSSQERWNVAYVC